MKSHSDDRINVGVKKVRTYNVLQGAMPEAISNIPKIVHLSYSSQKLSASERRFIDKIKELHSEWEIKEWIDPIDPVGFELSHLWPACRSGAQLADLVRVEALYRFGGVYIDVDFDVVQPFDRLLDLAFFVGTEDGFNLTNALFGSCPGHPALLALMDELRKFTAIDLDGPASQTTGPALFSRVLGFRKDVFVLPRETFYPYNYNECPKTNFHPSTIAIHKWHGSWLQKEQPSKRSEIVRSAKKRLKASLKNFRYFMIERLSKARILPLYHPPAYTAQGEVVVQTIHRNFLWADAAQVVISPELICFGFYELGEELFLRRWLKGGDQIIDVGANIGILTILAASLVGPMGRVISYEPNPAMAKLLKKSIIGNWVQDRVRLHEKAVGDGEAVLSLRLNPLTSHSASLIFDRGEIEDSGMREILPACDSIPVDVVALDDEIHPACRLRLVKIDVEGFEASVLRGMRRLVERRQVDAIMLEASPGIAGSQWDDIVSELQNLVRCGYAAHSLGDMGRLAPFALSRSRLPRGRNMVFVSESVLDQINGEIR